MIFGKVRKSQRDRWCQNDYAHDRRIRPGDLYETVTATPDDPMIGSGRWMTMAVCSACLSPERLLEYFINDRRGRALVAAIHQRNGYTPMGTRKRESAFDHDPCCSTHRVPMSCDRYRRTHFVEVRPCCAHDAERLSTEAAK